MNAKLAHACSFFYFWELLVNFDPSFFCLLMQSERLKASYHPYLLVAFHLNCLPEDILAVIPRSTRFDWHHREIHNSFGYDWFKENEQQFNTLKLVAQNRRLLSFNKALLRVIALKRFIENNSDAIRTGRSFVKSVAVNWVQKIANHIGVKQVLRLLNLSHQYNSQLKSKAKCVSSQLNICRIKHPSQLLANEIASIKNTVSIRIINSGRSLLSITEWSTIGEGI